MEYPLAAVPLSICITDGTIRKTNKSELAKVILTNATNEPAPETNLDDIIYIVDLTAFVRTISQIPETFEDLAFKIIKSIPSDYKRVDIVSDSYQQRFNQKW